MNRAGELLDALLKRMGLAEQQYQQYASFFQNWQRIAGERIAAHAQVVDVRNGALIVEADHPAWVQMVMFEQRKIIDRVNKSYPELRITALRVRIADRRTNPAGAAPPDPAAATGSPETGLATNHAPAPQQSENEKQALGRIEDSDLRDTLQRLRQHLPETPEEPSEH